jgi:hypothetical protein
MHARQEVAKLTIDLDAFVHVEILHFVGVRRNLRIEEPEGEHRNLLLAGMEKPGEDMESLHNHAVDLDLVNRRTEVGVERRNLRELGSLRIEVAEGDNCCSHS